MRVCRECGADVSHMGPATKLCEVCRYRVKFARSGNVFKVKTTCTKCGVSISISSKAIHKLCDPCGARRYAEQDLAMRRRLRGVAPYPDTRKCLVCGTEFPLKKTARNQSYCSPECGDNGREMGLRVKGMSRVKERISKVLKLRHIHKHSLSQLSEDKFEKKLNDILAGKVVLWDNA